jgi:hypothetical protein
MPNQFVNQNGVTPLGLIAIHASQPKLICTGKP